MLRIIGIISTVIDHASYLFIERGILPALMAEGLPYTVWLTLDKICRTIGRMAFPIFALDIERGYLRTGNFKRYVLRLLLLAFVSEPVFDFVKRGSLVNTKYQNAIFTLLIGLCVLKCGETLCKWTERKIKISENMMKYIDVLCWGLACFIGCSVSIMLRTDYGWYGVLLIAVLYIFRRGALLQSAAGAIWGAVVMARLIFPYFLGHIAAFILIYLCQVNPKNSVGNNRKRRHFLEYAFYPLHLLILSVIYVICF